MPKFAALHREGRGIIRRVRDSTTGCGALDSEAKTNSNAPTIVPRPDHCISRSQISRNCLKVLYRLKEAGFQAFLVGGGVRDLLLGREPKDFDVVTDAWPEDVRKLFRNCRLIGRRFRLAHVYFGREVIEVATFRAAQEDADVDDEAGELVRDEESGVAGRRRAVARPHCRQMRTGVRIPDCLRRPGCRCRGRHRRTSGDPARTRPERAA